MRHVSVRYSSNELFQLREMPQKRNKEKATREKEWKKTNMKRQQIFVSIFFLLLRLAHVRLDPYPLSYKRVRIHDITSHKCSHKHLIIYSTGKMCPSVHNARWSLDIFFFGTKSCVLCLRSMPNAHAHLTEHCTFNEFRTLFGFGIVKVVITCVIVSNVYTEMNATRYNIYF